MIRLFQNYAFGKQSRMLFSTPNYSTFTSENDIEQEPETNFVKLIGKICNNPKKFPSGALTCKVLQCSKTRSGESFTSSHMLTIKPKILKTSGLGTLTKGQRISVNGYIRSIKFNISPNCYRSAIAIVPSDIEIMENDCLSPDLCIVLMTAYIESRILDDGKHMAFSLRTHVPFRNDEDELTGETLKHSHSVVVADSKLQDYIRSSNIAQYDRIFLEGALNYKRVLLENGNQRICGNIIPIHIEKI